MGGVIASILGVAFLGFAIWVQVGDLFHRRYPRQDPNHPVDKPGPSSTDHTD